jgi:PAS domain S-box-containing protein
LTSPTAPNTGLETLRLDSGRRIGGVLLLAIAYAVAAKLGLLWSSPAGPVSPFWPAAGVALVALLRHGTWLWPGVFLGVLVGTAGLHQAPVAALLTAAGGTMAAVAGVAVLRRTPGFRASLDRTADVSALAAASVLAPILSATVGVGAMRLSGSAGPLLELWSEWWAGDAFGTIIVASLALAWTGRPLRYGLQGGTAAAALLAVLAAWATAHGLGPLASIEVDRAVHGLQLIVAVTLLAALMLGAAAAQRKRTGEESADGGESLRALFDAAPAGIAAFDAGGRVTRWNAAAERILGYSAAEAGARAEELDWIRKHAQAEPITGLETVGRRSDGMPISVTLSVAQTRDARGRITGAIAVIENAAEKALAHPREVMRSVVDPVDGLPDATARPDQGPTRSGMTILLVEDEDAVRGLTRRILAKAGYTVLTASGSDQALHLATNHPEPIDLLLTDMVMSGLSGPRLAEALVLLRPQVSVVYMSGYSGDAISHHGVLPAGATYLQKPFTPAMLTRKVREVMQQRPGRTEGALAAG